jgi:hypothetical protein
MVLRHKKQSDIDAQLAEFERKLRAGEISLDMPAYEQQVENEIAAD